MKAALSALSFNRSPTHVPNLQVDLQVEEGEAGEGDDAGDDDLIPPAVKLDVDGVRADRGLPDHRLAALGAGELLPELELGELGQTLQRRTFTYVS